MNEKPTEMKATYPTWMTPKDIDDARTNDFDTGPEYCRKPQRTAQEANTELIAQRDALLEACKQLCTELHQLEIGLTDRSAIDRAFTAGHAAIARATQ